MPLKRKAKAARRRPRLVSDAAVLAALNETSERMPEPTPEELRRWKKENARFDRWREKAHARWDAMTPAEQAETAAEMLRDLRRYDSEADERDLGEDGGRGLYGVGYAADRLVARWEREKAKNPKVDVYAAHRAGYTGPTTAAKADAAEAVRRAPDVSGATANDEPSEPKKARRRRPAGFAGYIDPRLIDDDDYWED